MEDFNPDQAFAGYQVLNGKVGLQFHWHPTGKLQFLISEIFMSNTGQINSFLYDSDENLTMDLGSKARWILGEVAAQLCVNPNTESVPWNEVLKCLPVTTSDTNFTSAAPVLEKWIVNTLYFQTVLWDIQHFWGCSETEVVCF